MKFENTKTFNFEGAVRGMRNPMDSWNKSDSFYGCDNSANGILGKCEDCLYGVECSDLYRIFNIGENDLKLAQKLIQGGGEHRKFLRQIMVSVDITAPRYWWTEFDTYKVGTVANSCSTMHKLKDYPFSLDMFEIDDDIDEETMLHINETINYLELIRQKYIQTKDITYFRLMKKALPEGFLQKRTVTLDYENIFSIIQQRSNHRLKEWSSDFINWTKSLPYANELLFLCKITEVPSTNLRCTSD